MQALDTEDDGRGTPNLFCAVHDKGQYSTHNRLDFLAYLSQQEGDIWTTNLEYDLYNVFGAEHLSELSFRFGHSALLSARWRKVRFLDTVRHVPASVKQLGEWTGLPKLERNDSLEYCFRDAAITRRAAGQIVSIYEDLGSGVSVTLASNARKIWAASWAPSKSMRLPIPPVLHAARAAYTGGRVECFHRGLFRKVSIIDISSAFPWAMLSAPFPIAWGPLRRWRSGMEPDGLYFARVNVPLESPYGTLPYKSEDGLCFPRGAWEGWFFGVELASHVSHGGMVSILEGWEFISHAQPFHAYITTLWDWKAKARGLRRTVCKLLLNGLYGKFGERGDRTQAVSWARFRDMKPRPLDARLTMGLALYQVHAPPPPWANVVWSALVTARARVRLLGELYKLHAEGVKVLYCDTDGIFFQGASPYPLKASGPGGWELRGVKRAVRVVGKKEYGILEEDGWHYFAKGIPAPAREAYLNNGVTTFERPNRLREAVRRGITPNVWETREKRRKKKVDTGPVEPIIVVPQNNGEKKGKKV